MERLGLAVSGGPDSAALLLLAHRSMPGRIAAATVDHGLRAEAAEEAAFVAALCAERAIPHTVLRPAAAIVGNLQSSARRARYALLDDWRRQRGLPFLATAHHADDQLETLLMRLARGSGLAGLSGIRRRNDKVLRPLLDYTKAELIASCAAAGVAAVDDQSNRDHRFDRARMRALLADHPDAFPPRAAIRTADALAEGNTALDWITAREAERGAIAQAGPGRLILHAEGLPRALQRRLLARALGLLGETPRGDTLARALDTLTDGARCSVGAHLCTPRADGWHIEPAPQRGV